MAEVPYAANAEVRRQIVGDYIREAPDMIAEAPQAIAEPARLYITGIRQILTDLSRANLQPNAKTNQEVLPLLTDPTVRRAGDQVISYVKQDCNYTIGG